MQRVIRRVTAGGAPRGRAGTSTHGAARRQDPSNHERRTRFRRKLIIAIDGPAGSGKSSTAKALAKALKIPFIDTGAMYRAVTLKAMSEGVSFADKPALVKIAERTRIELRGADPHKQRVFLDGKDVSKAIRSPEVTRNVFHIAQLPAIRREMVQKQRRMGLESGGVMEGRDIGTKVFPKADYKFYFEANPKIRALRRYRELMATGQKVTLPRVLDEIKKRDLTDYRRKEGPLRRAKDSRLIDTSSLTIQETVDKILRVVHVSQAA